MAARVMGAKAVALHLLEESSGRLELSAAHNTDRAHRAAQSLALGEGIVGEVARDAKPLTVTDVRTDPRFRNTALAAGEGLASLLSVPLMVRGRIVGVLSCYTEVPHEFSPKEVDLFSMLANQTALAIENARLVISTAIVREMHHRVKNNLQSVAMLLRMQLGAAADEPTRDILGDAMAQILSIAAVHETMSEQGLELVDLKQVLERIARNAGDLAAGRAIRIDVAGDALTLPSRTATSLALCASELVQNALKHAFGGRQRGQVTIRIEAGGEQHHVQVVDDGIGNPSTRPAHRGLGLELVQTLATQDLKGRFDLTFTPEGTRAEIRFPAAPLRGATP
jgi:two-component sensor histidine kinase